MCYLIAKKFNEIGCLALEIEHGKRLSSLSRYLTLSTLEKGTQIVTISNMEGFMEYAPYTVITSEPEFITRVLES